MPIDAPDNAAKTYLQAIGAAAIYVATDNGKPVSVGVARDLDKALGHLRRIISPTIEFGWVAWASNTTAWLTLAGCRICSMASANAVASISVTGTCRLDHVVSPH